MAEFMLVNISVFVMLTLPFAAAGSPTKLSVSAGDEITLLCQNAKNFHDRCNSITWIFGRSESRTIVTLFEHGRIHSDAEAQSHRLSVTANCSLVIKKVTSLDEGHYSCRQFKSGQQVSDFMAVLSVSNTVGTPPANYNSNVTTGHVPGKDTTNATITTKTTTAKPKSTRPTSTPTPAQTPTTAAIIKSPATTITTNSTTKTRTKSDMTTTIIKTITTTTNVTSLITKTTTMTIITTKTISPDTITTTKSNTTIITIKSPTKTKTFNSTTTTTIIKPARAAEECPSTVQDKTMLIIVAGGFAALFIMMAVIILQISKRNKTQMSGNSERSTNHSLGPRTDLERVHNEHNRSNAMTSSSARVSYASSGASTDGSNIYATMRTI